MYTQRQGLAHSLACSSSSLFEDMEPPIVHLSASSFPERKRGERNEALCCCLFLFSPWCYEVEGRIETNERAFIFFSCVPIEQTKCVIILPLAMFLSSLKMNNNNHNNNNSDNKASR